MTLKQIMMYGAQMIALNQEKARSLGAERGQPVLYHETNPCCDVLLFESGGNSTSDSAQPGS